MENLLVFKQEVLSDPKCGHRWSWQKKKLVGKSLSAAVSADGNAFGNQNQQSW